MLHLGDVAQVVARFSPLGHSIILTQDRCMVCDKCTIGSKFVSDTMILLGDVGHVESCFGPFGDSVSVSAR